MYNTISGAENRNFGCIYPSKLKVNLIVFTPINLKFTWSVSLFQDFLVSLFGVVKKKFRSNITFKSLLAEKTWQSNSSFRGCLLPDHREKNKRLMCTCACHSRKARPTNTLKVSWWCFDAVSIVMTRVFRTTGPFLYKKNVNFYIRNFFTWRYTIFEDRCIEEYSSTTWDKSN